MSTTVNELAPLHLNSQLAPRSNRATLPGEATSAKPSKGYEAMARRRFQSPKPFKEGQFWWLRVWDTNLTGSRKRQRIKLAPADMPVREVQKIAGEKLHPINSGLVLTGSAMSFNDFVISTYMPVYLPLLASGTQSTYKGVLSKHLKPVFGNLCLRNLSRLTLQAFFSDMAGRVPYPTISKVRDTLSSVLRAAVDVDYLNKNPMEGLRLPLDKRPRQPKPTITPEQFHNLMQIMSEPYATMVFVAVWTGLRVSELIGLKWRCIHEDSITIAERFSRGDWSTPKTHASAATIAVPPEVITRILNLKSLTVGVRAGWATRKYKVVKSDGPDDLIFQSVQGGHPMIDQNVLKRHLQPAARQLGLPFVNWRCLRTSHATWLVQSGADPKSVQGQMRHSRITTTMEIYAQIVPQAQRRALEQLSVFAGVGAQESRSNSRSKTVQ
jgi:integrase